MLILVCRHHLETGLEHLMCFLSHHHQDPQLSSLDRHHCLFRLPLVLLCLDLRLQCMLYRQDFLHQDINFHPMQHTSIQHSCHLHLPLECCHHQAPQKTGEISKAEIHLCQCFRLIHLDAHHHRLLTRLLWTRLIATVPHLGWTDRHRSHTQEDHLLTDVSVSHHHHQC